MISPFGVEHGDWEFSKGIMRAYHFNAGSMKAANIGTKGTKKGAAPNPVRHNVKRTTGKLRFVGDERIDRMSGVKMIAENGKSSSAIVFPRRPLPD